MEPALTRRGVFRGRSGRDREAAAPDRSRKTPPHTEQKPFKTIAMDSPIRFIGEFYVPSELERKVADALYLYLFASFVFLQAFCNFCFETVATFCKLYFLSRF